MGPVPRAHFAHEARSSNQLPPIYPATDGFGMNNFYRTLRLVFRYKWTLAASTFTAIMVALLWGLNISGVFPVLAVISSHESLQDWLRDDIAQTQTKIDGLTAKTEQLQTEVKEKQAELKEKKDAQASAAPADQQPSADQNHLLVELHRLQSELTTGRNGLRAEQSHLKHCLLFQPYVEKYLPGDAYQALFVIMMVISAGYILKNIFLVLDSVLVDRLSNLVTLDLRKKFYRRTLRMDLGSFSDARVSELMTRFTNDIAAVNSGIQTVIGKAVREPLKMLACLIFAALICWRLLVISLLIAPLAGYLIRRLSKTLKRANRKALEETSTLYNILSETFGGIKVVKAFTMERHERLRFHQNSKAFYRKSMKIAWLDALIHPVTELAGITMICLTILAGTYLIIKNETYLLGIKICDRPLEFTDLALFYAMLAGSIDPARRLSDVFNSIQRAFAASDRVYQLFDREPSVCNPAKPRTLARHHRHIVFDEVCFSYLADQPVLRNLSLRIPYGETLAIVGANGSGKTTLANLIARFYDPNSGSIHIDDVDLREVRLRDLRSQIGLVTQEPLLFDDTVFNNIRYGSPLATKQQVIDAARKAYAHRFIEELLEKGYDTNVGQLGGRLSGGQRQRISLARAILRDPPILILDEATSQIDLESEQLIHKVLEQFARGRTSIIITHRLQTLDLADRVLVLDNGRVADLGTHDELVSRCDLYRRLYQIHLRESA
ncbi:MAG TPA: ABC transporter ATP-binding protein [Pirellulales bacterium]|nr:ABC transporter ATP-binding protein [Pirellulales bacterium]